MRRRTDTAPQRAAAFDQAITRSRSSSCCSISRPCCCSSGSARSATAQLATISLLSFLFFMARAGPRVRLPLEARSARMAMMEYMTTKKDELVGWIRKFSLFPYPVRDRVLRHGIHVRELDAVRHRPFRRGAAALHAAAVRSAHGSRHREPQDRADTQDRLRADVRAEVGHGVRRVRDAAAASTATTRWCRASTRSFRWISTCPVVRRARKW